ncbi:MAG: Gfo/Idh/MocA family oxidoreductase [Pseudomonadota bacterium]
MMKLCLVGVGAIAAVQHRPAISDDPRFTLAATVSRNNSLPSVENFKSIDETLEAMPEVKGAVLCVPPSVRHAYARKALDAGLHVFLEKPPGLTVGEVDDLKERAIRKGVTLFASWHSRYAPAVDTLRQHLAKSPAHRVVVSWREDVRVFHPGQQWIWEPGGFGVFDPGINAFSILTHILPPPLRALRSDLFVPENRAQPIRAELALQDGSDTPVECVFDFDQPDPPTWDIIAETDAGTFRLAKGGAQLFRGDETLIDEPEREYPRLYERFAELCERGESDVDTAPLRLAADCFLAARTAKVAAFNEDVPAVGSSR